ncbi:hypothetical protein [Amycolatopsis saalfeldensis]|uniref:Beta-lactamase class A n=1 Tax=Amycolatopsis saalfeldensis TaxID=394193 RepID=A0A1H8YCW4_9PSEU|nr:hypothetical protein [Amycolatopsis saalfeldensis]SEP49956.1 hypothetical protein SAMN04489732_113275 [Amycolatopsis saalfeldensis]
MRKVNLLFLVGLCLGALTGLTVVVLRPPGHSPVAVAEIGRAAEKPITTSETPEDPKNPSSASLEALLPQGHVSALVFDRAKGTFALSVNADRAYTSASLVKLLIALNAQESGESRALIEKMLSHSDDAIASRLWVEGGETSIVTNAIQRMGLTGTQPPSNPGRWGDTKITAADVVRIYDYLLDEAPAPARDLILNALHDATEYGSDGFRQYFGIPDAVGGLPWAVKQGWSCCDPTMMLHTTGLVGKNRYLVVVLTEQPKSVGYDAAKQQITNVVKNLLPLLGN